MNHITWPTTIKEKQVELIFIDKDNKVIGTNIYEQRTYEKKKMEEKTQAQERN